MWVTRSKKGGRGRALAWEESKKEAAKKHAKTCCKSSQERSTTTTAPFGAFHGLVLMFPCALHSQFTPFSLLINRAVAPIDEHTTFSRLFQAKTGP